MNAATMTFTRSSLSDWRWVQTDGPPIAEVTEKSREEYAAMAEKVFKSSVSEETQLNRFLHNLCKNNRTLRLPQTVEGRVPVEVRRTLIDFTSLCETSEDPKKVVRDAFDQALSAPKDFKIGDFLEVRWVNKMDKRDNPYGSLGYFQTTLYPAKPHNSSEP